MLNQKAIVTPELLDTDVERENVNENRDGERKEVFQKNA